MNRPGARPGQCHARGSRRMRFSSSAVPTAKTRSAHTTLANAPRSSEHRCCAGSHRRRDPSYRRAASAIEAVIGYAFAQVSDMENLQRIKRSHPNRGRRKILDQVLSKAHRRADRPGLFSINSSGESLGDLTGRASPLHGLDLRAQPLSHRKAITIKW
jgi:hypothetical protein